MRSKNFFGRTAVMVSIAALLGYSQVGSASTATLLASSTHNTSSTRTAISIVDEQGQVIAGGQDIAVVSLPSISSFAVTNKGSVAWTNPSVTLSSIAGVTLESNTCTGSAISPGRQCYFKLAANGNAGRLKKNILSETDTLSISGTNLTAVKHNVVVSGGLAVIPELDPNYMHLSSRTIKLTNTSGHTITIGTPTISGLDATRLRFCAADSDCPYPSDCGSLANGGTCHLWFEALKNDSAGLGLDKGTITVNI